MLHKSLRHSIGSGLAAALIVGATAGVAQAEPQYQIHGYLSQGFVMSSDNEVLGIPTAGTTDWRRTALQLRMLPTDQDQIVLQVRERRLGTSLVTPQGDEGISLDWAFAQHSFGTYSLRAGRMPQPRGIYNQIRDVGIINPFYRAPYQFYLESFDVVEGAQFNARGQLGGGYSGDIAVFGGEAAYKDFSPVDQSQVYEGRAQRVFGAQGWLATPVQGLRVGGHFSVFTFGNKFNMYQLSADGAFERFMLRGEYRYAESKTAMKLPSFYAQAGVQLHPQLWVYGMYEKSDIQVLVPGLPGVPPSMVGPFWSEKYTLATDLAASLVYKPSSALALKLEAHNNEGYNYNASFQEFPISFPALGIDIPASDPLKSTYVIASVSIAY